MAGWERGAAAEYLRSIAPRRWLTGEGQSGNPRLGLSPGLAVAHVRDMGNALAALAGLKGVRGGAWFRGGLVGVAKHAGERVLRGFQGLRPTRYSAKRTGEVSRVLTEAWNGRGRDADVPAVRSSGGSRAAFAEGVTP